MEKEKVQVIAEKVKAFALAFIGVCFFSMGTTYFQERLVYRLPRILIPVLDFFGNVGLAIAMILLGLGLVVYGFVKWKSVSQKKSLYWIIVTLALIIGTLLAFFANNKPAKSSSEIMQEIEDERQNEIEEIKNIDKLSFHNKEVEKHLADFDKIYKEYLQNFETKDDAAISKSMDAYSQWAGNTAAIMQELNNDEKTELVRYLAKLSIQWGEAYTESSK